MSTPFRQTIVLGRRQTDQISRHTQGVSSLPVSTQKTLRPQLTWRFVSTPFRQAISILTMSMKPLVAFFILLIPLDGACDGVNDTAQAVHVSSSGENQGYDTAFETLFEYIIPTVAVAGVCGNVAVLVVWCAETTFNPTIFLVKCLAVTDIITLLAFLFYMSDVLITGVNELMIKAVVIVVLLYFRMVTAHTTLGVVVTRWVAVYKPLTVHILLTKRRVVVGYVFMLLWCLTPGIPVGLLALGHIKGDYFGIIYNVSEGVYLALPILLLVIFNVSLVYKVCSHRHSSSLDQQQRTARAARSARLLGAVLCLSITTVLAYPVGMAYRVLYVSKGTEVCEGNCSAMFLLLTYVLEMFNSSINVVYYLLFASRFRELCGICCCCCCRRCCRPK